MSKNLVGVVESLLSQSVDHLGGYLSSVGRGLSRYDSTLVLRTVWKTKKGEIVGVTTR